MNEITIKKIWTESGNYYESNTIYEIELTIKSDSFYIKKNVYVCNDLINRLVIGLRKMINFEISSFYFETTPIKKHHYKRKKENYNEGFSFDFNVDNLGHISCIVEVEIDNKKDLGIRYQVEELEFPELQNLLNGLEKMNNAALDFVASSVE